MKIFLTCPDLSVHGGIRVILEWATRLSEHHDVHLHVLKGRLQCDWYPIPCNVRISPLDAIGHCDLLIITSPHSIHLLQHAYRPGRVLLFMQMCEHLFRPNDRAWQQRCAAFYTAPHPMVAISRWNIELLGGQYGRTGPTHHVGNGVNLYMFPVEQPAKDGLTVLVEGWEALNPTKDVDGIGPQVAAKLKQRGYRIVAYSQARLRRASHVPDEYHHQPTLQTLNRLYREATILLKCSRLDARSCAPMEAMTKGTPTVRAIELGDDDLLDGYNCLRAEYGVVDTYNKAVRLLQTPPLWLQLSENCYHHLNANSWRVWMPRINDIINTL